MSNKRKESLMAIKFLLFSVSAGIIQIGSLTFLNEVVGLENWISYLISLILSVLWNFTFNRKFTFKSAANVPIAMIKVAVYYAVFVPVSTYLTYFMENSLGWNEYIADATNMILNFVTEFIYQRFFVFGKSIGSAEE